MWRPILAFALLVAATDKPASLKTNLVFLTRDDCVNTPDMMFNLDDALKALGWPKDYQFINMGKLPANDVRTGYPTPTLLWKGKDIFGMPAPKPPYDVPSWRVYKGGVPTPATIAATLEKLSDRHWLVSRPPCE